MLSYPKDKREYELSKQRERIYLEKRHMMEDRTREGKQLTYNNQQEAAQEIIQHFIEGKIYIVLVAQPGVGKTGTVMETQIGSALHGNNGILAEDIYVITGMSDKDWQEQFSKNLLPSFKNNVYHRSNLAKHFDRLSSLKNGFIITDECHIANGKDMILSKTLKNAGLLDIELLEKKNNKLLDLSATPEGILIDSKKWGDKSAVVILKPGPIYKGFQVMLNEKRLINSPLLKSEDDVRKLLQTFDNRFKESKTKKYFLIRNFDADINQWLQKVSFELDWDEPIHHNSEERIDNIDSYMNFDPPKNRIILVKGFWKASKRLIRTHVGGTYEPTTNYRDTTGQSQSLTARFCDNYNYEGDHLNINLRPIHYCDLEAIKQYLNWFNKGCDYRKVIYTSPRIKSRNGKIRYRPTKSHPTNVNGLTDSLDEDYSNIEEVGPFENLEDLEIKIKKHFENKRKSKISIKKSWEDKGGMLISTRCQPIHGKTKGGLEREDRINEEEFKDKQKFRLNLGLAEPSNIYSIFPVYRKNSDGTEKLLWYARYFKELTKKKKGETVDEESNQNTIIQN